MIQFAHFERLWLLALLPCFSLMALLGRRRGNREWRSLGQNGRLKSRRTALWLAAGACLILAVAEPRWGFSSSNRSEKGRNVAIAVDVSRSMGARDAFPNRLGLAAETAASLIETLGKERGTRVAIIAFSGRGAVRCPLTANLGAALDVVKRLRSGEIEPNGTDLGSALDAARQVLENQGNGAIILFTDGEDHSATWRKRIEPLRAAGIVVHALALGDLDQGSIVPAANPSLVHRYEGREVTSKRDDSALEAITAGTGGALIRQGVSKLDLGPLYESRIEPTAWAMRRVAESPSLPERFEFFVIAAFACAVGACRVRRGTITPKRRGSFTWFWLLLILMGASTSTIRESVERGRAAYREGQFSAALGFFQDAKRSEPANPILLYDEAAAQFQLNRFEAAFKLYQTARKSADPGLRVKIDFALGNAAVGLEDFGKALKHYQACLNSAVPGSEFDRVRRDALLNQRYAEARLEEKASIDEADAGEKASASTTRNSREAEAPDEVETSRVESGGGESRRSSATGGAGGGGKGRRPGSLENSLESAVENVRQARERRIDDSLPSEVESNRKDW